jgi:hypothetical protein
LLDVTEAIEDCSEAAALTTRFANVVLFWEDEPFVDPGG